MKTGIIILALALCLAISSIIFAVTGTHETSFILPSSETVVIKGQLRGDIYINDRKIDSQRKDDNSELMWICLSSSFILLIAGSVILGEVE